jgi:3-oxoacyl-[acyl-carrier-protein] synthase II
VLVDSASGQLAISLGIKGPNYAIVSACATGSHAIGEAAELIKRGDADAVLAGGAEACMHPLILAGFTAMRGLAVENEDPPHASRPFDATRAGFVMGEGACVLVLEELEAARAAPPSTRKSSATARPTTRTTWLSPSRRRPASRR